MALRQTTQAKATEAQLLTLPPRADAIKGFAAQTDEAVMGQSLSSQSPNASRKLRGYIVLANALAWIVIAIAIRLVFF